MKRYFLQDTRYLLQNVSEESFEKLFSLFLCYTPFYQEPLSGKNENFNISTYIIKIEHFFFLKKNKIPW